MHSFTAISSAVIPLAINNVDTDMIIPAQYLTQIERQGYGQFLFKRLRDNDDRFVFNQAHYSDAAILLAGTNFGCGSSREHAVWALQQAGIKVIIAESFSDIFYNNAAQNGLLLITLSTSIIEQFFQSAEKASLIMDVDLAQQTVTALGNSYHFDYDAFRKTCLLNGYDDMDYLLSNQKQIQEYHT